MKTIVLSISLCLASINAFCEMPNTLSKADKVYGLSKFWQEVNYNFVFFNKVNKETWDNEYKRLITEVQNTANDYEYFRLLQKLCALLKDGHTNVYFPDTIYNMLQTTHFGDYRIFLTNINGKAIITRTNLSKKDELPIGTEVIKVNGMETKEYIKQYVAPYISSSTDYIVEDWSVQRLFEAPTGSSFNVDFKLPNGKVRSLKLTHSTAPEKEVYPPLEKRELMETKWIKDGILYISLNSFDDPQLNTLFVEKMPELCKAKRLIIDLRYNDGGDTYIGRDIMQYLTTDTILYGSKSYAREHIPPYKAWGEWVKPEDTANDSWAKQSYLSYRDNYYHKFEYEADTIHLKAQRITVPIAILIGHTTASAAEDFLIYADNQAHITTIGERTFGSTGQPLFFKLPGGGAARVCTKKDTYPDGREFIGYGIKPDIEVKPTLQDFMENNDPVLQTAITFLKEN